MKMIKDFNDGDKLNVQLLVGQVVKGVTNNGLTYLNIDFKDASGSINGKKWEVTPYDEEVIKEGNIIQCLIEVILYKSSLQVKVLNASPLSSEEIDLSKFIKSAPIPKEELRKKLDSYIEKVEDKDLKRIVNKVLEKRGERINVAPAAVSVHHDYASGLLHHTVSMLELGEFIINHYENVSKDMLYSAIILHDVGKTIEMEGDVAYKYTLEGKLLGHISIINALIKETADELNITGEKVTLLQHTVLSHHGQLEFGSPVIPLTKEALILSMIDNMDSKIVIASKALEGVKEGEFSQKIFPLDQRALYKPNK